MKMWSIKVIILLLFCYARPLTGKVYFVSKNFNNVLHWDPMEPASPEEKVLYSVQYRSDVVDSYQIKKECHNITALSCDLTAETASVYDFQYEARVFVNGSCYGKTTRFKPLAETIFGPPILKTYTTVSSLHVDVTLPLGPNGISIADIINTSTQGPYKSEIIYTLHITEPKWAALVNKSESSRIVINLKNEQTTYCGHVFYNTRAERGRPESQNASFCVTLEGDHRKLLPWLLTSAVLLAGVILMLVLCMYRYAKGGKPNNMPQSLVTTLPIQQKVVMPPDDKLHIFKPMVCTASTVYATISGKQNLPSIGNGGYSPQDLIFQTHTGSSVGTDEQIPNRNLQDTSAQSSEMYSVVAVHVPAEKNEDNQQPTTGDQQNSKLPLFFSGGTWNKDEVTLATPQDLNDTESTSAESLMLNTVRNPNGQLILSSLVFQLQSNTGDEVSPLASERKPLLSDLIDTKTEGPSLASLRSFDSSEWSDSGCDDSTINTPTIYSPAQTYFHQGCLNTPSYSAILESGYKQNWFPEILLGAVGKDNCEYKKNYP